MAKQIITMLKDDLTGDNADQTVTFGLDGVAYTIDLSDDNAKVLRSFLERYIAAGTRAGRIATGGASTAALPMRRQAGTSPAKVDKEQNIAIRDWANRNGFHVAERGRISQHIIDAFHRGTPAKMALRQNTIPMPAKVEPPAPEPEPIEQEEPAKPVARRTVTSRATKTATPAAKVTAAAVAASRPAKRASRSA